MPPGAHGSWGGRRLRISGGCSATAVVVMPWLPQQSGHTGQQRGLLVVLLHLTAIKLHLQARRATAFSLVSPTQTFEDALLAHPPPDVLCRVHESEPLAPNEMQQPSCCAPAEGHAHSWALHEAHAHPVALVAQPAMACPH
eukprot:1146809-Pelagomonas_calceolata.AAC.10